VRYLCVLMLLILAGCAGTPADRAARNPQLAAAEAAAQAGRYREAIEAYRQAAAGPEKDAAAEALFQAAYLLAYYENPRKDYAQSLQAFELYIRRYPAAAQHRQARNWRAILKTILDLQADIERLNHTIEELKKIDISHEEKRDG
jgi:tetratricopeptide (TPR) repeat protein